MRTLAWTILVLFAVASTAHAQTETATVLFEDQTSTGLEVVVTSTTMSDGGFLTIHDDTLLEGDALGSVVGVTEYLGPGVHTSVVVPVADIGDGNVTLIAMPHRDTDGDEQYDFVTSNGTDDGPYTQGGEAVTDDAVVNVLRATVTMEDQTVDGDTVTVASTFLPAGGFLTLHDRTLNDGDAIGSVVATSPYLESGKHTKISITVDDLRDNMLLIAMPHRDTDDDQTYDFVTSNGQDDGPYTKDGAAVTDPATIRTAGTDGDGTTGGDGDDADAPGFGLLAALMAIGGALFLARRK